jgi:hypothetical protein
LVLLWGSGAGASYKNDIGYIQLQAELGSCWDSAASCGVSRYSANQPLLCLTVCLPGNSNIFSAYAYGLCSEKVMLEVFRQALSREGRIFQV